MKICEALGKEPDLDRMPLEDGDFPFEVQKAFFVHELMPDIWDGASCSYFGKDWAALDVLLNAYSIEDKSIVVFFLKYIELFNMNKQNDELEKERKRKEVRSSGAGDGGINVHG